MRYQLHFDRKFYLDKKTGYWISTDCPKIRAHRWVWSKINGKIPKGFHIHHKDMDKSNNEISNLEILSSTNHLRLHMTPERRAAASLRMEEIRPLTKVWHASKEGIEWHSRHGIEVWDNKKETIRRCIVCDKEYSTKTSHQRSCSNKCKARKRRLDGVDDVVLLCQLCGNSFMRNKYAKGRFCSKSCSFKTSWSEGKVNKKSRK